MLRLGANLKNGLMGACYFVRLVTSPKRRAYFGALFLDRVEGETVRRAYERFCALGTSAEVLRKRPDPASSLDNRAALGACPPGSLGRVYLDFMVSNGLESGFITEASDMFSRMRGEDEQRTWYRRHISVAHDLRHVISGYDVSPRGEFCSFCFSLAQTGHVGVAWLALLAASLPLSKGDFGFLPAGVEAYRRGKAATSIDFLPWELSLETPLAQCRASLGLEPPARFPAHVAPEAYVAVPAAGAGQLSGGRPAVLAPV